MKIAEAYYIMPRWLQMLLVLVSLPILLTPAFLFVSIFFLDDPNGDVFLVNLAMYVFTFVVPAMPMVFSVIGVWLYGRYEKWYISMIPISIPIIVFFILIYYTFFV